MEKNSYGKAGGNDRCFMCVVTAMVMTCRGNKELKKIVKSLMRNLEGK